MGEKITITWPNSEWPADERSVPDEWHRYMQPPGQKPQWRRWDWRQQRYEYGDDIYVARALLEETFDVADITDKERRDHITTEQILNYPGIILNSVSVSGGFGVGQGPDNSPARSESDPVPTTPRPQCP